MALTLFSLNFWEMARRCAGPQCAGRIGEACLFFCLVLVCSLPFGPSVTLNFKEQYEAQRTNKECLDDSF
jgi:hypothetical protein